ncbi:MAG TPA: glycosyltransferase family 4 protein [Trichocoleus sp.]|jgi:glycosyltransferase involved in cell wall biosynthesis
MTSPAESDAANLEDAQTSIAPSPYLFVFLEVFAQEGGIQSYVQDIFRSYLSLKALPQADVLLLRDQASESNPFQSPHLKFHCFQSRSARLGRLKFSVALLTYLVKRKPQRVFCGHIKLAPLIRMFCQPLGIPYTVLTYGKEVWEPLPPSERDALQQADRLWTISRYSRNRACAANLLEPAKIKLLPCAVDSEQFSPGEKPLELLQQYGLQDSRVLMTVARLWSGDIYKGVDVTLRALPSLAQAIPDVKYLVIGRGDDQPRLAKLASELGVSDRVIFAGFVPTQELVKHYRLADAYVMPSQEGFGIVYLEAMACGLPVLAGDADGSADPLQDGKLGWHVPHRNSTAVAQACITILQERAAYLQHQECDRRCDSRWLRQQVLAHFSRAAFTEQLQLLLNED